MHQGRMLAWRRRPWLTSSWRKLTRRRGKREEAGGEEPEEEELEAMCGPTPDGWLHPASLVSAIFGRPAGANEDLDLKLKMTSGKTSGTKLKEAETESVSSKAGDESAPSLSTKGLKLMNVAGGKHSRSEMKKLNHEVNSDNKRVKAADAIAALQRRALEAMSKPLPDSKSTLEMCESVKALTKAVVSKKLLEEEEAERKPWKEKVWAKESKLRSLDRRGKGESEEAHQLEEELLELYDNPVVAPLPVAAPPAVAAPPVVTPMKASPSLAGGDGGGIAGGEVAGNGRRGGYVNDAVEVAGGAAAGGWECDAGT